MSRKYIETLPFSDDSALSAAMLRYKCTVVVPLNYAHAIAMNEYLNNYYS